MKNVLADENSTGQVGAITCAHGVHNQDVDEGVSAEDVFLSADTIYCMGTISRTGRNPSGSCAEP